MKIKYYFTEGGTKKIQSFTEKPMDIKHTSSILSIELISLQKVKSAYKPHIMKIKNSILLILISLCFWACNNTVAPKEKTEERIQIEMTTNKGIIVLELYNETPKHRDNFAKLAKDGAFDSLLFHRVIEHFMIQGGDPDSKYAKAGDTLGNGDLPYMVDAEFHPDLFHKKGVLAAARDGNLKRASSAMQFYIVQGKVFNDSLLQKAEDRINENLAVNAARNLPENKSLSDALAKAMDEGNMELYFQYNDSLKELAKGQFELYKIPEYQREIYKTKGGTPHLDQNYTVFGEVISGLEIVDSIAAVSTDAMDRPLEDVLIVGVRVLR